MGLQVSDFAQSFEVFWFCAISLPNQDSVAMALTGPWATGTLVDAAAPAPAATPPHRPAGSSSKSGAGF